MSPTMHLCAMYRTFSLVSILVLSQPHTPLDIPKSFMLHHTVARSLRQASRAGRSRSKSPFTTLTKTRAATHSTRRVVTWRGEADWAWYSRAMMSSNSAGSSHVSRTETYLDYALSPEAGIDHIKSTMTCTKFHDSIWGFVVGTAYTSLSSIRWSKITPH